MNSEAAFRAMNRRTVLASILSALFLGASLTADNEIGCVPSASVRDGVVAADED